MFLTVLACGGGQPHPEFALTTGELERYYATDRMTADGQYTGHNLKISGVIGSIDEMKDGASLLTFKSSGPLEVLCRFDKPEDAKLASLKPGTAINVVAYNAGLVERWIKLFNCAVID